MLSAMDSMMEYFESKSQDLDRLESSVHMMAATYQYVSCIKVNGVPILPPVLSEDMKNEMKSYRHKAVMVEKRLQSKHREQLIARAEKVVKDTQVRRNDARFRATEKGSVKNVKKTEKTQDALSETGQFDSLSSGLMSLDDGSLPTDFYGLPCTSVHEQQISQVLQKLSKQLNLKDTLSSTGGSEGTEENATITELALPVTKLAEGQEEDIGEGFRDSQDTVVEVLRDARKSKPPTINITPNEDSFSNKDSPSRGYASGDSSYVSSANTSASERAKGSPKSLKNTVHFSNFVKVLDTDKSVAADNITLKRLEKDQSPIDSPVDKTGSESVEGIDVPPKHSLLSQVMLSPVPDPSTPSPDVIVDVPFQTFSSPNAGKGDTDEKVKTSDKNKSCASPKLKSCKESDSDSSEKKYPHSNIKRNSSLRSSNRSRVSNQSSDKSKKGVSPATESSHKNTPQHSDLSADESKSTLNQSHEELQNMSGDGQKKSTDKNETHSVVSIYQAQQQSADLSATEVVKSSIDSIQHVSSSQDTVTMGTSATETLSSNLGTEELFGTGTTLASVKPSNKSYENTDFIENTHKNSTKTDSSTLSSHVSDSHVSHESNFTLRTFNSGSTIKAGGDVSNSQTTNQSDFNVGKSDSGSTIKAEGDSPGHISNSTSSDNLYRYLKHIEGTLESSTDHEASKSQSNSVAESVEKETNADSHQRKKKGHVRKGSYTLDMPSPVLVQAQSRRHERGEGVLGVDSAEEPSQNQNTSCVSSGKSIQRKLDYEDDMEDTRPVSLPMPPGPEAEGKVEHINRYLSQVQKQQRVDPSDSVSSSSTVIPNTNAASLSSTYADMLLSKIKDTQNLSEEEALALQSAYIEALKKQLMEQQKSELEELFVQQRREQIHLQTEISSHQKQRKLIGQQASEKKPKSNQKQHLQVTNDQDRNTESSFTTNASTYEGRRASRSTPKHLMQPTTSTPSPKVFRPVVRSPVKPQSGSRSGAPVKPPPDINDVETQLKFFKVTALAKGFLTRRLLHSEKVQEIIKTIRDTREFAFSFQAETSVKAGTFSNQDRYLLERIIAQLQAALLDIHEIFFLLPIHEKLELIRQTRQKQEERRYLGASSTMRDSGRKVSAATLKAMERKRKAQEEEISASTTNRPKTAPATSSPRPSRDQNVNMRALKPLQGQISPIRSDGSSSNMTNHRPAIKERPKTAPEKITKEQKASKNRKISNAAPTTVKTNKTPTSNNNNNPSVKIQRKVSSKGDKAWR